MVLKKLTAILLTACTCIFMVSCDKSNTNSAVEQTTSKSSSSNTALGQVELKKYDFPEFLSEIKLPDVLSNKIYSSFDFSAFVTEVKKQPFDDYVCKEFIGNSFYTFIEGEYTGLLDKDGNIVIEADKYAQIQAGSSTIMVLSYDKKMNAPDDYARIDDNGKITTLDGYTFNNDDITINEISDDSSNTKSEKLRYEMVLSDENIVTDSNGDSSWDKIEQIDMGDLDTTKVYAAYYKVTRENAYYYICIDKYYNYTIFGGSYAYVKLKVGNVYGECYLLSYDDYSELNKMIESFGKVSNVKAPTNDETLDYIQITFGLNTDKQTMITISSDGYCLTDELTSVEKAKNTYFSCLDKESFVSLVLWVDQVMSQEYKN